MKKVCAVCLSLFIVISITNAQNTSFGIKAGYNSSKLDVKGYQDWETKSGLHGGVFAHIHVSSHFAVQPEIVYSCEGGERTNSKLKLSYINIPVLAQYMVNDGFRIQTGPQVGFLVSAKTKTGDVEVDTQDELNTINLSWVIGAGYVFSSGLGIDLRYNIGLNNISDQVGIEARSRVLQAGLFYQFHQNKTVKK